MNGWPIVGVASVALVAMTGAILATAGTDEEGLRLLIRATARTSIALFALAFTASSLRRLWHSELTAWLLRNRRQLGVSFAISHYIHLGAIVGAAEISRDFQASELAWQTVVFGGLAYVFITAMTATSFDRSAAWLGRKRWTQLHTVGGWYLWLIFAQSYLPRAFESPAYVPVAVLVLGILALRIGVKLRGRARAATASLEPDPRRVS